MLDQDLERRFLTRILKDVNAATIASQKGIATEFFQWSTAGKLYAIALWYTQTYGTLLSSNELDGLLKQSTTLSEDLQRSITVLFDELQVKPIDTDINFLYDQMLAYYKQNLFEATLRKAGEKFSEKLIDEAIIDLKYDLAKIESKFRSEVVRSGQLDTFAPRIHWEYDDRKLNPDKYKGLKIGFRDIDKLTGGLTRSSVSIIMAPPKEFKSALAMNICYNAAKKGIYSYYHANEGTVELFYMRYAAMELCIPLEHIYKNEMTPTEESRWLAFIQSVEAGTHQILNKIYFDEVPAAVSTPELIVERIKKLKEDGKMVGLVVVDHFGRMTISSKETMQDWQKKGLIAQQICSIALSERTPFILLTHVKSSSAKDALEDNRDFDAYDIERSGQPLKDVDYVFSWRIQDREDFDRNGKKGFANLALVLSRHSETGTATLEINGKYMQIQDMQVGGTVAVAATTTP